MRWRSHLTGDAASAAQAASATELSRWAVFLNSRLVCVSELIIAISPSVSSVEQLGLLVVATPKEREGLWAVIGT